MAFLSPFQRVTAHDRRAEPREGARTDRRGPLRPKRLAPTRARIRGPVVAGKIQCVDAAALLACALTARGFAPGAAATASFLIAPALVLAALFLFRAYGFGRHEPLGLHLGRVLVALCVAAGVDVLALEPFVGHAGLAQAASAWLPLMVAGMGVLHLIWWRLVRRWREGGRLTPSIVVVGATGAAERLVRKVLAQGEINVLGVFDDRAGRAPRTIAGVPVLGDTEAMVAHRIMPFADRVVITVPARARNRVGELIARLKVLPNEIVLLLDGDDAAHEAAAISRIAETPLAHISGPPTDERRAFAKRAQDLVVGATALMAAAPLMALIALAVRLDSPGPALFRQRRHGFNNEEIVVWKFRSMRTDAADFTASRQVVADDDRVTRVGRFIRRTSLDELPQLLNVLTGEMSLVGPRPHAVGMRTGQVESSRLVAEYAHRHRMKPGMTGWAAIHGSRGPVDTPDLVRRRVALDIEYIERQSFWLDLYILAMTIPCLLGDRATVR